MNRIKNSSDAAEVEELSEALSVSDNADSADSFSWWHGITPTSGLNPNTDTDNNIWSIKQMQ